MPEMNKARITGILLLIIGICMIYFLENEKFDFFSGALVGLGIGLSIIGRFKPRKSLSKH